MTRSLRFFASRFFCLTYRQRTFVLLRLLSVSRIFLHPDSDFDMGAPFKYLYFYCPDHTTNIAIAATCRFFRHVFTDLLEIYIERVVF